MEEFKGRHAFVTGGASGIGLAIAEAFVDVGMTATIADIREDHIETALAGFAERGQRDKVEAIELDVADREAFARAADADFARYGRVDILVNNAGVGISGPIAETTFDDWDFGIGVNLYGAVNGLTLFLPRMIAGGHGGHIVNVSSLSGITAAARNSAIYAVTKAGLVALTESIRDELADHDIGVSVLMPGPFKTNIREVANYRPERYRAHSGYGDVETKLAQRADDPSWADPKDAAKMVMDAIRNNTLYVITHGDFKGWAEGRFEEILAAFPYCDPARLAALGRRRPAKKE